MPAYRLFNRSGQVFAGCQPSLLVGPIAVLVSYSRIELELVLESRRMIRNLVLEMATAQACLKEIGRSGPFSHTVLPVGKNSLVREFET